MSSKIPTASVLVAFSKESVNLLSQGIISYHDLQQKVNELNGGDTLKAFLFGTQSDGNLIEFSHEVFSSDRSSGPANQGWAGFKLKIIDPKNIFERFFIAYYARPFTPKDILDYTKNRLKNSTTSALVEDKSLIPPPPETPSMIGEIIKNIGSLFTDTDKLDPNSDTFSPPGRTSPDLTKSTFVPTIISQKQGYSPVSLSLPVLYFAYGNSTNPQDWAGPFIGRLNKVNYTYLENGVRVLDLEFLSDFGKSINDLDSLDAFDKSVQWNPKISILKTKNNKVNTLDISNSIQAIDKTRNDLLFARKTATDLINKRSELGFEIANLQSKQDLLNLQIATTSAIIANDSPSSFQLFTVGNTTSPEASFLSNFFDTHPPLISEKLSEDYYDRIAPIFEQTVVGPNTPQGALTIPDGVIKNAYSLLVDSFIQYQKNIYFAKSELNNLLAQSQKYSTQIIDDTNQIVNITNALNSLDPMVQDLQNTVRDENLNNTLDNLQNQSNQLKNKLKLDKEFKDLDFIIWEVITSYINTFNVGSRRTIFMIPSIKELIPEFITRVTEEIKTRYSQVLGDPIPVGIDSGAYTSRLDYFKTLAIYSAILNALGFNIEINDKSNSQGVWHPISWESAARTNFVANFKNTPLQSPTLPLDESLLSQLTTNNRDLVKYTDIEVFVSLPKMQGTKYYEKIEEFFSLINGLSRKELIPMWMYEYNYNYITFFEKLFSTNSIKNIVQLENNLIDSDENKTYTRPITILGDPELIYRFLYFPEIKNTTQSPNTYIRNLLNDKKDIYPFGEPWITIYKNFPYIATFPKLPTGDAFGDIFSVPEEYAVGPQRIFTEQQQIELHLAKIPVFKYGTSNPNVVKADFNLGAFYTPALLSIQSISPLTGFLNLLNNEDISFLTDPKGKKIKDLQSGPSKDLILKLIAARRHTGVSLNDSDNYNYLRKESIGPEENIPDILTLLGLDNLPEEDLLTVYNELQKLILLHNRSDLPYNYGKLNKTDNVQSSIIELLRKVVMTPLTGTLTTLPYFRLSSVANTLFSECIFLNKEPRIINRHGDSQEINSILSGRYKIFGFKHEISNTRIQSSFTLIKNP
jgi:hypothetical protein